MDEEGAGDDGWEWRVVRAAGLSEELETIIGNLRHFTRYEVVVRAFNQVGHGPPSPPLYAVTQEGGESVGHHQPLEQTR
jgi:hypothetical protein